MHLLFIDESGSLAPKGKHGPEDKFVLGGLIVSEDTWFKVDADLRNIKKKYGIFGEIKWRYFYSIPGKDTPLSKLDEQQKEQFRTDIFRIISSYKSIRIISVVADIRLCYQRKHINTEDDLYWFAYKRLIERFQYYLQDLSREAGSKMNGIVICDHRERRQDKRLQDLHYRMMHGQEAYTSHFDNILEGVFIVPSHFSTGIQLADMTAGGIYRWYSKKDDRFYKQIFDRIRTGPGNKIEGYGIVQLH
ncbi:DUF3800 domain-containing protein [Anaerohalosphaeraceae bacterium U12dextr]